MTLLSNLPHTVWVQNYVSRRNEFGSTDLVRDGDPIPVRAFVQDARSWSDAEEYLEHGLQLKNLRVVYARTWPGDVNSRVFFDGFEFVTEGEVSTSPLAPKRHPAARLRRVRHVRISLYRFGLDEDGISTGGRRPGGGDGIGG